MAKKPRPAEPAPEPVAQPYIRFSANCLIGGAGIAAPPGARVRVRGSARNDGDYTVAEAGDYWLRVTPHVLDEAPCPASVTILENAA